VKRIALIVALLVAACGKSEGTINLVKEVAADARTKPRVTMSIKLSGDVATPDDLALQKRIEDRIEQAHVGRLISSGTDAASMNVVVEVDNTANGITELRKIAQTAEILPRTSFRVSSGDER
jgi:hypothetical protein